MSEEIRRDNFLDVIDNAFESGAEAVLLTGPEGIGKTTVLRQYVSRHAHTIELFIRPISRLAYDLHALMAELHDQACHLSNTATDDTPVDRAQLDSAFQRLRRKLARSKTPCTIIIDGLSQIPKEEQDLQQALLDTLPFGVTDFRFLFGGPTPLKKSLRTREVILAPFTLDDTVAFLQGHASSAQAQDLHKTCRGIPGHLASVLRVIRAGTDIQTLLSDFPLSAPALFEREWDSVDENDSTLLDCLTILTLRTPYSLQSLATILHTEAATLLPCLSRLGFITTSPHPQYVSEPFRAFASQKLDHRLRRCRELVLDHLMGLSDASEAVLHAPEHMASLGQDDDLLRYLSPAHFLALAEQMRSLAPLSQRISLGLRTAHKLRRDGDIARFALHASNAAALVAAQAWRIEIDARVRLGDVSGAKRIASASILKEVRLRQLAHLARILRTTERAIDPDILHGVAQLFQEVDRTALGEVTATLAADLFYCRPDLAIQLIEEYSSSQHTRHNDVPQVLISTVHAAAPDSDKSDMSGAT